jgi:menaquinone-dependent protoporphyrinogen oxidase
LGTISPGTNNETISGGIMSSVLVAYATKTGCTKGVAEKIGETLSTDGFEVDVVSVKDSPVPSGYEAVIVGSGARAGGWHGPAKKWVSKNAGELKSMPVAFFTTCLTMESEPEKADEVRAYTDKLLAETGIEPFDYGLFAGWFIPDEFGFVERTILEKMNAVPGDFRDWNAITAWTKQAEAGLRP